MGGDPENPPGSAETAQRRRNKLLPMSPYETRDDLAYRMIISDSKLQQCRRCVIFEPPPPGSALILGDPSCVPANDATPSLDFSVPTLMDYAVTRPNNILVPPYTPPSDDQAEEKEEEEAEEEDGPLSGPSAEVKANQWTDQVDYERKRSRTTFDNGAELRESSRSLTHDSPGTGRRIERESTTSVLDLPREGRIIQQQETTTVGPNEDFRDKFPKAEDVDLVIAQAEAEARAEASVASGDFGDEGDVFSGSGSVLGAEASAKATGQVTHKGINGEGEVSASAHMLKGELQSDETNLVHGNATATAVAAEASANVSAEVSAEEFTLGGGLKAAALLGELEGEGTIEITPKRIGNSFISTWNYITDDDVATLGDEHDWGLKITVGASAALGAQAEAEGEVTASSSRVGATGKAKLAIGAGVGVKAGAEVTGLDKVYGSLKSAGVAVRDAASSGASWVGNKAASGWSSVKSGWNSLWD